MNGTKLKYIIGAGKEKAGRAKVFCAFHPENRKAADRIMQDIIAACDCTVFYYENGECSDEKSFKNDFSEMSLLVTVVSSDYLFTESFARDTVFQEAVFRMIPILPIMIENGLEKPFNELMGPMQYLLFNSEQYDVTSVPYEQKLKNYLSRVLTDSENTKRIRDAFDAGIFLSYRKKDRSYAQELMRLIHSDESLRGISIWYDEFLVPGEDFDSGIRDELERSFAVILVVTPHIAEKDNYIILTEYPCAVAMNKTVIPFEMCETRRSELDLVYSALPPVIPAKDVETVRSAIMDCVKSLGIKPMESLPEKEYLRGLAYLRGICVEKNTQIGAGKIRFAAKSGVAEAVRTMSFMCRSGEGVDRSLREAAIWQERYIATLRNSFDVSGSADCAEELMLAYLELCEIYEQKADYDNAVAACEKITELCHLDGIRDGERFVELHITALVKAGDLNMTRGEYFDARYKCFEPALKIREEQRNKCESLLADVKVCELYALLAECCEMCTSVPDAKSYTLKLRNMIPASQNIDEISSENFSLIQRILSCNNKLSRLYVKLFDYKSNEAFICIGNSVILAERLAGISDSYNSRYQLMRAYINDGDQHATKKVENHLRVALEAYVKALTTATMIRLVYGETLELSRDIARIMQKQAFVNNGLKNQRDALGMYDEALERFRGANKILCSPVLRKELYDCLMEAASVCEASGDTERACELLLEATEQAGMNVSESELAVYKKDKAAAHGMIADIYKKQWDMDSALIHAREQCDLLRAAMKGTGRLGDIRLFAGALEKAIPMAKLAGEFSLANELQSELSLIVREYGNFI
ncbi:MAG: toll/interleukin-1 receptor domain-containing protein [Ruminococcaceae bacterium]|nr:toll/interleukin-1 receptor domain-containing protein [Oscillospiraceae bacterium]